MTNDSRALSTSVEGAAGLLHATLMLLILIAAAVALSQGMISIAILLLGLALAAPLGLMVPKYSWRVFTLVVIPAVFLGYWWEFAIADVLVVPSLLFVAVWAFWMGNPLIFKGSRLRQFPLFWPMIATLVGIFVSVAHSVSTIHWVRGLLEVSLGLAFLIYPFCFLKAESELNDLLQILLGLGALTAVLAIMQRTLPSVLGTALTFFYSTSDRGTILEWRDQGRMVANWLHPSYLGSVLNIIAPLALWRYIEARKKRILHITIFGLIASGILLTNTRTPIIAFLVSLLLFAILSRRIAFRPLIPVALLLMMVLAFPSVFNRFNFAQPENDVTVLHREILWVEAFDLFSGSPVTGIGARNYVDRAVLPDFSGAPTSSLFVHNVFLQQAAETGLLGLAGLLFLLCASLRVDFKRVQNESPKMSSLRYALFCSSIATLLECLSENALYVWQIACLFWLIRGLAVALHKGTWFQMTGKPTFPAPPAYTFAHQD